jgi:CHAT domain-containing protein
MLATRTLSALLALAPLAATWIPGASEPAAVASGPDLVLGAPLTVTVPAGGAAAVVLDLAAGEHVRIAFERWQGAQEATWSGPGGAELLRLRLRTAGREPRALEWTTAAPGRHRLELRLAGEDQAAGSCTVRLLERRAATPDDARRLAAQRALLEGEALRGEGDEAALRAMLARYAEAVALRAAVGDREDECWVRRRVARLRLELGEIDEALAELARALAVAREVGSAPAQIVLFDEIAYAHYTAGHREESLAALEAEAAAARAAGDVAAEAEVLGNLGAVHASSNEDGKAIELYRRALALDAQAGDKPRGGDPGARASLLSNLALSYSALGDAERAREAWAEALALFRRLGDRHGESSVLQSAGLLELYEGERERGLADLVRALEIRRALGSLPDVGGTLGALATAHQRLGRSAEALAEFREEIAIGEERGDVRLRMGGLYGAGEALASLGERAAAVESYRQALALGAEIAEDRLSALVLVGLARVRRDLGELAAAREEVEAGLAVLEAQRAELPGLEERATYLATIRRAYELRVDVLLRLHGAEPAAGWDRLAFEASEAARARALVELLAEGRVELGAALPAALRAREAEAAQRLTSAQLTLRRTLVTGPRDAAALRRLEAEVAAAETQRREVGEEVRVADPRLAAVRYPRPASVEQTQGLLAPDAALVAYLLGEEGSQLFVLTREGLVVHALPPEREIAEGVARLRELQARPGRRELATYATLAARFHETLLGPARAALAGKSRLLVAPDGALHHLAFEALLTAAPRGGATGGLPFLVRRWAVAYVPSATALAALRAVPPPQAPGTGLLAVGDPSYGEGRGGGAAAPSPGPDLLHDLVRGVFGADGWRPRPLPNSRREVEEIARLLGGNQPTVLLGAQATEENLKASSALASAPHLHFATHALVSERAPQQSALVLALATTPRDDGLLQAHEIYGLRLDADLVVLSACQTALGREVRGEGLIGMTRAFLHAGARSVVVSLWEVADRSTAELMIRFYRALAAGQGKADALREAKLALLADPGTAHPYYWAPFVLVGDPGAP